MGFRPVMEQTKVGFPSDAEFIYDSGSQNHHMVLSHVCRGRGMSKVHLVPYYVTYEADAVCVVLQEHCHCGIMIDDVVVRSWPAGLTSMDRRWPRVEPSASVQFVSAPDIAQRWKSACTDQPVDLPCKTARSCRPWVCTYFAEQHNHSM